MVQIVNAVGATRSRGTVALSVAFALFALMLPGSAHAGTVCPAQPSDRLMRLPHLQAAINRQSEALIVAIGSSSTEGVMASDIGHSYPAILQAALAQALPNGHVAVLNRGMGGQDAAEELERMATDVVAVRPQLAIWQVGANGALRKTDPLLFDQMVTKGVTQLKAAGIDVILMDNQRSPRILAAGDHLALEETLANVAHDTGANLFSRGHLMDAWSAAGSPPAQFIATDGLHHNDFGYLCIARALARDIVTAISAPVSVSASR